MEMQRRFRLMRRGDRVLDLGASPGSWSLYATRECAARVVAVDLKPMVASPAERLTFIRGDLFDEELVRRIADLEDFQVLLSDAAPSTTGSGFLDAARSFEIAEQVLAIAELCLAKGGNLMLKVFQGGEEKRLMSRLTARFQRAQFFRPRSSPKGSSEIYLLGLAKKNT
jgi:23S rRNA (uridine2552-2'-O)-methyltransferase